jgi:hypothetical protein
MTEVGASASPIAIPDESPSDGAPDYTNETDGNYLMFFLTIIMICSKQDNYSPKKFHHIAGEYITRTMSDEPITSGNMNIPQQSADQVTSDKSNGAHKMTQESRAQRRARERAHKHSTASHDMQQQVAHRRAIRKNIPNGERHGQQQRSNAKFSAKKTTPRANLSDAATSSEPSPASNTLTTPLASASSSTPLVLKVTVLSLSLPCVHPHYY